MAVKRECFHRLECYSLCQALSLCEGVISESADDCEMGTFGRDFYLAPKEGQGIEVIARHMEPGFVVILHKELAFKGESTVKQEQCSIAVLLSTKCAVLPTNSPASIFFNNNMNNL